MSDKIKKSPKSLHFRGSPRLDPYARAALAVRGSARCKNRGACPRFLRILIVSFTEGVEYVR